VVADTKRYRAGESLDDLCRACKIVRRHTVMVVGSAGEPLRVVCDYCGSQHNYRGGGSARAERFSAATRGGSSSPAEPPPLVSPRERSQPAMSLNDNEGTVDLELMLRRILREEAGMTPVAPAEKWRGGELVLRPGKPGLQEKSWPIETLFSKVIAVRNRLRVLEQQINGAELPNDVKIKLQGYITACYGSLTSFNILFADEDDRFRGSGGSR
jgi:hypothetical protein